MTEAAGPAVLRLGSDLSEVARLNDWYAGEVAGAGVPPDLAGDLKLCLNEAVANVLSYAFEGDDAPAAPEVEVRLLLSPCRASAEVIDNGFAFDPLSRPRAAPLTDLATAGIGGFGITLIRETAAEVRYRRAEGRNHLTMVCVARAEAQSPDAPR